MGIREKSYVTRSDESITLVTSSRFPHHGYKSFTFIQDDD